jgi:7-cyano-7-deazaguanine synthase
MSNPKAVVLLSGGLDSTTTLAIAQEAGYDAYAISFRYGQRHHVELDAAREIARRAGVIRHVEAEIDLRMFGGSALTDAIDVPKGREADAMSDGIPVTYVPARNTVFLSFAIAWSEVLGADDIFIGVNALDYSGYPDCRPEYIASFEQMANLATKRGVEGHKLSIHTPLIDLTKAQIIRRGIDLGVDYGLTRSCYDPTPPAGEACGGCDSCTLRLKGFAENDAGHAPGARVAQDLPCHRDLRPDDPRRGSRSRTEHPLRPGGRLRLSLLLVRHHVRSRSRHRPRNGSQTH